MILKCTSSLRRGMSGVWLTLAVHSLGYRRLGMSKRKITSILAFTYRLTGLPKNVESE